MAATKLGIIAGGGPLPALIAEACKASGREFLVVAFLDETDPATCDGVPHTWVGLGAVGALMKALRGAGCREVVLAGPIRRPSLSNLKLDLRGMRFMGKVAKAAAKGDDALLSLVVEELEGEGFSVVGADDLLTDLLAPEGVMGAITPDEEARNDVALGVRTARALGAADVGQAVIVQQGVVLGVEAVEGTDALMARCAPFQQPGPGGVLVKVKKPGQERRADLPTIGPRTIDAAADAGLGGIAVEAGETLVLGREAMVSKADERGIFVLGVS